MAVSMTLNWQEERLKKFKHCKYVMTDLGYYGLEQDGFKLLMPIKKKKNLPLFDVEKSTIK